MDRRTFLKAGAVAMVATPEAMRAELTEPRRQQTTPTPARLYRQTLAGTLQTGDRFYFALPTHSRSALTIDFVSFFCIPVVSLGAIEIRMWVFAGGPPFPVDAVTPTNFDSSIVLAEAVWTNAVGAINLASLNPPGQAGVAFPGGLKFAPNDMGTILLRPIAWGISTAIPVFCTVHGWEIPTTQAGTFPQISPEAAL